MNQNNSDNQREEGRQFSALLVPQKSIVDSRCPKDNFFVPQSPPHGSISMISKNELDCGLTEILSSSPNNQRSVDSQLR